MARLEAQHDPTRGLDRLELCALSVVGASGVVAPYLTVGGLVFACLSYLIGSLRQLNGSGYYLPRVTLCYCDEMKRYKSVENVGEIKFNTGSTVVPKKKDPNR